MRKLSSTLSAYNRKRKFDATPEPIGTSNRQDVKETSAKAFVVQKHNASHLHYDFRLEDENGVLKSWAVPKGPSMDYKIKRLAVLTEDHPYDYLLFEGTIPKGNYGAGTVIVWDHGIYHTQGTVLEQFQKGKISIELYGQKLRGKFSLVKTRNENQWLLIKINDEYTTTNDLTVSCPLSILDTKSEGHSIQDMNSESTKQGQQNISRRTNRTQDVRLKNKEELSNVISRTVRDKVKFIHKVPLKIKPMLASPFNEGFNSNEWVFEIKWDGVRAITFIENGRIWIHSRNGNDITLKYPEILRSLKITLSDVKSAIMDGEIVVLDKSGRPNFQGHQRRMNIQNNKEIKLLAKEIPTTYYLFDILYLNGKNIKGQGYVKRRQILSKILKINERIRTSEYIEGNGWDLLKHTRDLNIEGIVAKRKSSLYIEGVRSHDWLKIKNVKTQDCVVVGYTEGLGNRENYFGSLLLAIFNPSERKLQFVGHTGSGFDYQTIDLIYSKLRKIRTDSMPMESLPYKNRETTWIKPIFVAEVKFTGWTNEGIMRAPIFLRFRNDKNPEECVLEADQPSLTKSVTSDKQMIHQLPSEFSNIEKVYWKAAKEHAAITKGDLINYYASISELILPHLEDRPLSLNRYPDGVYGKSFYQKDWDKSKPEWVKTVRVHSEQRGEAINYLVCNNTQSLLWISNLGAIEMHPWYSRFKDFERCDDSSLIYEEKCGLNFPDFIVFDLDPYIYSGAEKKGQEPEYNSKGFKAAVEVAFDLEGLLGELKIKSFVKTSGKTGLHIYLPIRPQYIYEQTRAFAEIIGKRLTSQFPKKVTMEWNTAKRKGKVFFDHNQNSRGKTIASIYSVRPTATATVSMPIRWDKLDDIKPTDFTLNTVPDILRAKKDVWGGVLNDKQDLGKILSRVKEMTM